MKEHTRRVVAYIAGRLLSNSVVPFVYDYDAKKHFDFRATILPDEVNVFDNALKCNVQGKKDGETFKLFHHGNNKHITLTLKPNNEFEGYDFDSEKHYGGTVRDKAVSLFDHETEKYYSFSVENT